MAIPDTVARVWADVMAISDAVVRVRGGGGWGAVAIHEPVVPASAEQEGRTSPRLARRAAEALEEVDRTDLAALQEQLEAVDGRVSGVCAEEHHIADRIRNQRERLDAE